MEFVNSYQSATFAEDYSKLDFSNTYHLAFRDLPEIYSARVKGTAALDFGCGTGRSTRFLRGLGFETIGVDISPEMVAKAHEIDPTETGTGRRVLTPRDARVLYLALTARR